MKAYELLAEPESWTQGVCARDKHGLIIDYRSEEACSWSLYGAMCRCYPNMELFKLIDLVHVEIGHYPPFWNDNPHRTHAEVVELLRRLDI